MKMARRRDAGVRACWSVARGGGNPDFIGFGFVCRLLWGLELGLFSGFVTGIFILPGS
jgi:hypothetical protein